MRFVYKISTSTGSYNILAQSFQGAYAAAKRFAEADRKRMELAEVEIESIERGTDIDRLPPRPKKEKK